MSLKDDALVIKNEVVKMANTANRVGSFLVNALDNTLITGWWDYNNSGGFQNYVTPGSDLILTNNGLGIFTEKTWAAEGIPDIFNTTLNQFDFSELTPGDTWEIRVDATVNTDSPNQNVNLLIILDYGGLNVELPLIADKQIKTAGVDTRLLDFKGGYIKNTTIANGVTKFIFRSDSTATIKMNGFYFKLYKKSKQTV